jgi:hypothetical protein
MSWVQALMLMRLSMGRMLTKLGSIFWLSTTNCLAPDSKAGHAVAGAGVFWAWVKDTTLPKSTASNAKALRAGLGTV